MSKQEEEKKVIPVYVVFEGGGAKGIAHVGAVQAIQDTALDPTMPTLKIQGVAGTSAGAILAAFVAAGADARGDLYQPANRPTHAGFPIDMGRDSSRRTQGVRHERDRASVGF